MRLPQTTNETRPGENRTGATLHPELVAEMLEGTAEFGPTSRGGAEALVKNRARVAQISEPVATMPPLPEVPVERLPLLDKLGARLQFERTGTRLYEALIGKLDTFGPYQGGPTRADLERIRDDEHRHLALAQQLVLRFGGDPTVVTPYANLQSIAGQGVLQIIVDARTTLIESLHAILVTELTDRESWELLAKVVAPLGDTEAEQQVQHAERVEAEHLAKVRGWIAAATALAVKPGD